jgi:hypothetical protein
VWFGHTSHIRVGHAATFEGHYPLQMRGCHPS